MQQQLSDALAELKHLRDQHVCSWVLVCALYCLSIIHTAHVCHTNLSCMYLQEDACKKLTGHATAVEELHAKHKERARELKQRYGWGVMCRGFMLPGVMVGGWEVTYTIHSTLYAHYTYYTDTTHTLYRHATNKHTHHTKHTHTHYTYT